jgi:microcystin-dependent protein
MAQPFVGEIRVFAGNFNPAGWMFCDGALLPISEYETLFNLIGTTFGGDGQSTFALPDLRGRVPIHQGTNPGTGTNYQLAEAAGVETVTLSTQQMPVHNHPALASQNIGDQQGASGNVLAQSTVAKMYIQDTADQPLAGRTIGPTGGNQPHENLQPFLCLNFIISLFGIFPSQT